MTDLRQAAQQALERLEACVCPPSVHHDIINPLRAALKQQQAEPVACRFCHSEIGCWTWQCYNCGEIDDVQKPTQPAPPQRKPLTDEMRKQMKEASDSFEMRGAFANGWLSAEAAHHIQEAKS